jgi:S-adenosylmethionine decarboxylase
MRRAEPRSIERRLEVRVKDLAPHITRQRLLVEGFYAIEVDRGAVDRYLDGIAAHLGLRTYGAPAIFSPGGEGKRENQGFDAFLPLIDSGISLYVWSSARCFSAILYTCRRFDEAAAIEFTRRFFAVQGEIAARGF